MQYLHSRFKFTILIKQSIFTTVIEAEPARIDTHQSALLANDTATISISHLDLESKMRVVCSIKSWTKKQQKRYQEWIVENKSASRCDGMLLICEAMTHPLNMSGWAKFLTKRSDRFIFKKQRLQMLKYLLS